MAAYAFGSSLHMMSHIFEIKCSEKALSMLLSIHQAWVEVNDLCPLFGLTNNQISHQSCAALSFTRSGICKAYLQQAAP